MRPYRTVKNGHAKFRLYGGIGEHEALATILNAGQIVLMHKLCLLPFGTVECKACGGWHVRHAEEDLDVLDESGGPIKGVSQKVKEPRAKAHAPAGTSTSTRART